LHVTFLDIFIHHQKKYSLFDYLHKKALFLRSKIGDSIYLWINNILIKDMYLTTDKKQEFFKRLDHLRLILEQQKGRLHYFHTEYPISPNILKKNKKDFSTQRALIKLVGRRRRLLDYLKIKDIERYREIVKALKLRK